MFISEASAKLRARQLKRKFRIIKIVKGKLTGKGGVGVKPRIRTVFRVWVK